MLPMMTSLMRKERNDDPVEVTKMITNENMFDASDNETERWEVVNHHGDRYPGINTSSVPCGCKSDI